MFRYERFEAHIGALLVTSEGQDTVSKTIRILRERRLVSNLLGVYGLERRIVKMFLECRQGRCSRSYGTHVQACA
jgi:hypothetical protein